MTMSQRTPESEKLFTEFLMSNQDNITKLISMQQQQMIYINSLFFVSENSIEQQENKSQPTDNKPITEEDKTIRDKDPIN